MVSDEEFHRKAEMLEIVDPLKRSLHLKDNNNLMKDTLNKPNKDCRPRY